MLTDAQKRLLQQMLWIAFATLVFRTISSLHDGLSDRAMVEGMKVGWLPWHIVNWLRRDVFIAGFYLWMLWKSFSLPTRQRMQVWLGVAALTLLNYLLHNAAYEWARLNRHLFLWGQENPFWRFWQ